MTRLLLEGGADASVRDRESNTALMWAVNAIEADDESYCEIIRLLLRDSRTPVNARDRWGSTALMDACKHGLVERARLLLVEGVADHNIPNSTGRQPLDAARALQRAGCVALLEVSCPDWLCRPLLTVAGGSPVPIQGEWTWS